ncbi:MAG: hypothetical protein AB1486_32540 [Planctomycetota bacterium]
MRARDRSSWFLAGCIALAIPGCRSLPPEVDTATPARSLVGKALEKYGGREAYAGLRSLRQQAVVTYYGDDQPQTGRFLLEFKAPDRLRIEGQAGDRSVVQVQNGTTTHEWVNGMETRRDIMPELVRRLDSLFILALFEGGEAAGVTLVGTPEVAGHETAALEVERGTTVWTLYLDLQTYLQRRLKERVRQEGKSVVNDTFLDGHRFVDGRPFAWNFLTLQNGKKMQEAQMVAVEVNPEIPDWRFERP